MSVLRKLWQAERRSPAWLCQVNHRQEDDPRDRRIRLTALVVHLSLHCRLQLHDGQWPVGQPYEPNFVLMKTTVECLLPWPC
jgi:hypothetical protein